MSPEQLGQAFHPLVWVAPEERGCGARGWLDMGNVLVLQPVPDLS